MTTFAYFIPIITMFCQCFIIAKISCTIKNKGKLIHLNKSTILYCQHEDNVVGNQKISPNYIYKKIVSLKETYITNVARLKLLKQISNYPTFNYWLAKIIYSIIRIF